MSPRGPCEIASIEDVLPCAVHLRERNERAAEIVSPARAQLEEREIVVERLLLRLCGARTAQPAAPKHRRVAAARVRLPFVTPLEDGLRSDHGNRR